MANGISLNDPTEGTEDVRIYRQSDNIILKTGDTGAGDVLPETDANVNLGSASHRWNTMYGLATSAQYADLAEKYTSKDDVKVGDVVVISTDEEFDAELSNSVAPSSVLGVVSDKPAIRMNEGLVGGVFIALRGRVPCKVHGPVEKGDLLVGYMDGGAIAKNRLINGVIDTTNSVFAKALETSTTEGLITIEVVVL